MYIYVYIYIYIYIYIYMCIWAGERATTATPGAKVQGVGCGNLGLVFRPINGSRFRV